MIKVLSIGNSFSTDAQRYLHAVAKNEGVEMKCVNLYIGGCSLYTHYINILEDRANYLLEFNGEGTGFYVSVKQALISEKWDYITVQQASPLSFDGDSYFPYIEKLAEYIRLYAPKSKILVHETWAYGIESPRYSTMSVNTPEQMLAGIVNACENAAERIGANGIIRCGEAMIKGVNAGYEMHRDNHHVSLGVARYLLALVWFRKMTGRCAVNEFSGFDVEVSPEAAAEMREIAKAL